MKVIDLLKKYRMSSNSDVFLESVPDGDFCQLKEDEIRELRPHVFMEMTVQSFEVIDNVLTIYAKGRN